jgi:hypothetical protein
LRKRFQAFVDSLAVKTPSKTMNPTRISCKANEWKNILEQNLRSGHEIDLVNLNSDYDADYCRTIAREYSMAFEVMPENNYATFRKIHHEQ